MLIIFNSNINHFQKDKLTFDAVPTEDGPYCDSTQSFDKKPEQDDPKLYTISLEDIENEYLTFNDKKANFSVKYGDFLTNCDLMDLDSLNLTADAQTVSKENTYEGHCDNILNDNIVRKKPTTVFPILNQTLDAFPSKSDSVYTIHMTEVPVELDMTQSSAMLPYVSTDTNIPQTTYQENNTQVINTQKELSKKKTGKSLLKENKITILNEQQISESIPMPGKLEPVCPSTVLPLPRRKQNLNLLMRDDDNYTVLNNSDKLITSVEGINTEQHGSVVPTFQVEINNKLVNNSEKLDNLKKIGDSNNENKNKSKNVKATKHTTSPKIQSKVLNTVNSKKSNSLLLKNRIPPERIAAIEEKRKFNMKLRDIIASCLDKLDDDEDKNCNKSKLKSNIEKNITQKVSSYLSREPELPNVQEYTVSYLEARMKKMENILLNKIDQNSQRIIELKQSLIPSTNKKKSVLTQTTVNEKDTKKQLYHEISKYLSPETNSLVYEELFIDKFVPKIPRCSPTKKRKYR